MLTKSSGRRKTKKVSPGFVLFRKGKGTEIGFIEKKELRDKIKCFTDPNSRGKLNAEAPNRDFSIKSVIPH